jgi:hypothetical protein
MVMDYVKYVPIKVKGILVTKMENNAIRFIIVTVGIKNIV